MLVQNLVASSGASSTLTNGDERNSTYEVVHPSSHKVVHQVQRSSEADLERAIATCQSALQSWSTTPVSERCAIINKAAELIDDPATGWSDRLRDANIDETSVTHWWSATQMHEVGGMLRELIRVTPSVLEPVTVSNARSTTLLTREPFGVCLAIAPWNAAHLLTSRAIITPLLAGNTVVLKTSEHVPYTQVLWAELLYAAGLPKDCLSVLHVAADDARTLVPKLVADQRVRHVNFTGSTRVGSILAGLAGQHLKPSLMELGGKAPVLLLPDADIHIAASHVLFGAWMNAGQICMSTERVFVPESRYDELVVAMRQAWKTIDKKQPRALFSPASAQHVRDLIADAAQNGAGMLLEQADSASEKEAFIQPTIMGPANSHMRIFREETFGPIAVVVPVRDTGRTDDEVVDEMVALANDTVYGLTAAVWSKDTSRARKVAARLDCGAVHINSPANGDHANVPHGGWKASGWGRFNSAEGIRCFTQMRSIEIGNDAPGPLPLNIFEL